MWKQSVIRTVIVFGLSCSSGPLKAAEAEDTWAFELHPYLWVASLQGSTQAGDAESPIDPGYSLFTMENLHGAFMGALRVSRGHWSWTLDTLYVDYQDDFSWGPLESHVGVSGGFLEIAAGYRPDTNGNLEWLAGLRNVSFTTEVSLTPGPQGRQDKTWLDPFIGLRYRLPLSGNWALRARADVGGMNPSARLSMNGMLAMEYAFSDRVQALAGYRYLELDFRDDGYVLDLSASGFALGLALHF
jgi:hypothetical protein